jgi:hypothetical protein
MSDVTLYKQLFLLRQYTVPILQVSRIVYYPLEESVSMLVGFFRNNSNPSYEQRVRT